MNSYFYIYDITVGGWKKNVFNTRLIAEFHWNANKHYCPLP